MFLGWICCPVTLTCYPSIKILLAHKLAYSGLILTSYRDHWGSKNTLASLQFVRLHSSSVSLLVQNVVIRMIIATSANANMLTMLATVSFQSQYLKKTVFFPPTDLIYWHDIWWRELEDVTLNLLLVHCGTRLWPADCQNKGQAFSSASYFEMQMETFNSSSSFGLVVRIKTELCHMKSVRRLSPWKPSTFIHRTSRHL